MLPTLAVLLSVFVAASAKWEVMTRDNRPPNGTECLTLDPDDTPTVSCRTEFSARPTPEDTFQFRIAQSCPLTDSPMTISFNGDVAVNVFNKSLIHNNTVITVHLNGSVESNQEDPPHNAVTAIERRAGGVVSVGISPSNCSVALIGGQLMVLMPDPSPRAEPSKPTTAQLVAYVIGGLLGLLLIIIIVVILVYCCCWNNNKNRKAANDEHTVSTTARDRNQDDSDTTNNSKPVTFDACSKNDEINVEYPTPVTAKTIQTEAKDNADVSQNTTNVTTRNLSQDGDAYLTANEAFLSKSQ